MKTGILIFIVVVVVFGGGFLLFGGSKDTFSPSPSSFSGGPEVPDFSLRDIDGNEVSLDDFKGRPLVLNSWAVWCPFCRKELPGFALAQKEFGDKVVFIAIDRAESLEKTTEFTDEIGVTDDLIFLLDPSDSFYRSIGGFSMPETLFVDKSGVIIEHVRGPLDLDQVREKIKKIL